ncbi:hypothetical protein HOK021_34720 [Streptomyces hygroscopicus]|nr:hypothetical protein HOK021_34720 [Streptomyces hygroscopicus]
MIGVEAVIDRERAARAHQAGGLHTLDTVEEDSTGADKREHEAKDHPGDPPTPRRFRLSRPFLALLTRYRAAHLGILAIRQC